MSARLASLPEHGVAVAKHGPSGMALSTSGVASSLERCVVIIVAAINDGVTTKQHFVSVGSASKGDLKREQVPPGRR
jgi:hypothetical protein